MNIRFVMTLVHAKKRSGFIYCEVLDADTDEKLLSSTIDYAIDWATEGGHTIVNAQEVLHWLQHNATFVPHF